MFLKWVQHSSRIRPNSLALKAIRYRFERHGSEMRIGLPFGRTFVQSPGLQQPDDRFGFVLLDEQQLPASGNADHGGER